MTTPVYSTQFFAQGPSTTTNYTVPTPGTVVLRWLTAVNNDTGGVHSYTLQLINPTIPIIQDNVSANSFTAVLVSVMRELRVVIRAGQTVQLVTGASMYCTVSGYLFTT